jgi:hypothetical protein
MSLPHRAARRLAVERLSPAALIGLAIVLEAAAWAAAAPLSRAAVAFDARVLAALGKPVTVVPDSFLHQSLLAIAVSLPPLDYGTLAGLMTVGAAAIFAISTLPEIPLPVRYAINLHLLFVVGTAAYLLLATHAGYDGTEFSALLVRTELVMAPSMALFAVAMGWLFPLRLEHTAGLAIASFAYVVVLFAVRYPLMLLAIAGGGAVLMPMLYMLYGPMLDIVPVTAILMVALVGVSRRLRRTPGAWQWR